MAYIAPTWPRQIADLPARIVARAMNASHLSSLPSRAVIREVGLRDGLQSVQTIVPT